MILDPRGILVFFGRSNSWIFGISKYFWIRVESCYLWRIRLLNLLDFHVILDPRGNLVFLDDILLNLWDFQETTNPLKIPTPTSAPDRGGPVACLGGPVTCLTK